jgi:cyclohexyl-isocyanide hydratase
MHVGMLLFSDLTQLDLTGPFEVFHRLPDTTVHLIAKTPAPVRAEGGLAIVPTATLAEAPPLDVLFVPGGFGQIAATADPEILDWVRAAGERARWITSACTGSLLLGAAGLLRGYRATTHWAYVDLLPLVGALPEPRRVVVDRNRITGGGVTAGIDLALVIAAELHGRDVAERLQLMLEYDPQPPVRAGHPDVASPELLAGARAALAERHARRAAQLRELRPA